MQQITLPDHTHPCVVIYGVHITSMSKGRYAVLQNGKCEIMKAGALREKLRVLAPKPTYGGHVKPAEAVPYLARYFVAAEFAKQTGDNTVVRSLDPVRFNNARRACPKLTRDQWAAEFWKLAAQKTAESAAAMKLAMNAEHGLLPM